MDYTVQKETISEKIILTLFLPVQISGSFFNKFQKFDAYDAT